MFSRIFTVIRSSLNTTRPSTSTPQSASTSRLSLEDSSEEFVKKSRPILISNHSNDTVSSSSSSIAAIFGLSNNNADDFIQKDLISTSLY
ncbi:uncharacterized protein ATC70_000581 [Mucor velutinosus]|uniref:Uncharacterized protein n=1 Tax=Mucor velutinosus TaxID=708070 RepID=A0AAN7HNJ6_9FUNG|nr:hypothetical protein ATC70_000581 [Mucor velutinosus]